MPHRSEGRAVDWQIPDRIPRWLNVPRQVPPSPRCNHGGGWQWIHWAGPGADTMPSQGSAIPRCDKDAVYRYKHPNDRPGTPWRYRCAEHRLRLAAECTVEPLPQEA